MDGVPHGLTHTKYTDRNLFTNLEKYHPNMIQKKQTEHVRYVDNILIVCERTPQHKLKDFNKMHHKIKYTMELENDRHINFLDFKIYRGENTIELGIYWKPMDSVMHNTSVHPREHKMATFNHMFNRMSNHIPIAENEK
jgi:hypothetical protein